MLLVVSASFKDFDAYSDWVAYYIKDSADFNAIESKNGWFYWQKYSFYLKY